MDKAVCDVVECCKKKSDDESIKLVAKRYAKWLKFDVNETDKFVCTTGKCVDVPKNVENTVCIECNANSNEKCRTMIKVFKDKNANLPPYKRFEEMKAYTRALDDFDQKCVNALEYSDRKVWDNAEVKY